MRAVLLAVALALAGCAASRPGPGPPATVELATLTEVNDALARRPAIVLYADGTEDRYVYVVVGPRETEVRGKRPPLFERDTQPVRVVETAGIAGILVRQDRPGPSGALHTLCVAPGALGACIALSSDGSSYCAVEELLLPGLGLGLLGFVCAEAATRLRPRPEGFQEVYRGPVTRYADAAAALRAGVGAGLQTRGLARGRGLGRG